MRQKLAALMALLHLGAGVAGCASSGPAVGDRYTVYTPIFADNRVYYLARPDGDDQSQRLQDVASAVSADDTDVVIPNQPLSIVLRSIEIPASGENSPIKGPADYVVILDVGTSPDGSSQSLAVWYQRGVQPDQSLNFSNLLVYYEPRWDRRVAPFFRVRVMDVTTESNRETRRALERARGIAGGVAGLVQTPLAAPIVGIAFTAAELVLANNQNRMVLDYSVQLYSSAAQSSAGAGGLGALKRGSYVVVGRPNTETRAFWDKEFMFAPSSRALSTAGSPLNIPTALLTVGTFESIVPTLVIARSTALMTLLTAEPGKTPIEQIDDTADRLSASIAMFVFGERLKRYDDVSAVNEAIGKISTDKTFAGLVGSEDVFHLVRAISDCIRPSEPFVSMEEIKTYVTAQKPKACVTS